MNWKSICRKFKASLPWTSGWDGIVRGEDARRLERAMKRNETHKVPKAEYDRAIAAYREIGEGMTQLETQLAKALAEAVIEHTDQATSLKTLCDRGYNFPHWYPDAVQALAAYEVERGKEINKVIY